MTRKVTDPSVRFWAKVNIVPNNCWEWIAGKYYNGYGQFYDGKNKICAHRFSYKLAYGEIDQKLVVCHKCDNRSCVNPDHLFLGTQQDNIRDMYNKNRQVITSLPGSRNGNVTLTESKVLEMRVLYNNGTQIAEIARRFDTSETQTARIVKLQGWKHI
jgi:hypothetical protein